MPDDSPPPGAPSRRPPRWPQQLRVFGPVLLALTLCLPMSSCCPGLFGDAQCGKADLSAGAAVPPHVERDVYVWSPDHLATADPAGFLLFNLPLAAFTWPLIVLLVGQVPRLRRLFIVCFWTTPVFLVAAGLLIIQFGFSFKPMIGAYAGTLGLASCTLSWCRDAVSRIRSSRSPKY